MTARLLAASLAVLLCTVLPATAGAHDGHPEHATELSWTSPFVVGAAGMLAVGTVLGGIALYRVRGGPGSRAGSRPLALGAVAFVLPAALIAGAGWWQAGGEGASTGASGAYEGTALNGPAPDFQLVDHRGERLALSDLRGRVVLLAFLDPNCSDICPLTAAHFKRVHDALGDRAASVALVAVNVNPEAGSVADVAAASRQWTVADIPGWHFLTGSTEELQSAWRDYAIHGGSPKAGRASEVAHSPGVYVIDAAGDRRWYVSIPPEALLDASPVGPSLGELLLQRVRALLAE